MIQKQHDIVCEAASAIAMYMLADNTTFGLARGLTMTRLKHCLPLNFADHISVDSVQLSLLG